ncbi:MAG: PQQ-dependent sugar dehydrogenase [Tabrizicola sp.]|uniref:PQQ-dependent sugar dehydrogenase n=1 Tax=Tabrizicola sp. TaxID=2005166 RepID=UPI0027344C9D|nr:PQQ-dependent sugar dehydrogenase [Tabrizicola sp.]MDP3264440.1 PQQ-dependent sugar dehydrogenase [Tabrizicola sp.]MDP3646486.1 PQQ-dependent sugar dehydrogenase [Paracoccaceae bacterium]MDZ4065343.1 PQQ-dependent sugar dehydrogenase [Tabrizicola sp.]
MRGSVRILTGLLVLGASGAFASVADTSAGPMRIEAMAEGLEEPWAIGFLPDGAFLVTERDGLLKLFAAPGAVPIQVSGLPEVYAEGQGGLLDIMVPRDFARTREIWLSYSQPQGRGAGTALGKGVLSADGTRLEGFTAVFVSPEGGSGGRHFGSRVVEAADGTIFLAVGDRGTGPDRLEAQDPMRAEGKIIHLDRDGSPATVLPDALPGVYSLGHRNPQGMASDPQGGLWVVEHGAQGGDELNRIEAGRNYGWPVISYGEEYGGGKIGEGQAKPGLEQPVLYWDPSIAPSGLVFHSGALVPEWAGDAFTGSLKFDFISRLDPDDGFAEERISTPETGRVRDVVEAPDGSIWFLSVYDGAAYRMAPAQ